MKGKPNPYRMIEEVFEKNEFLEQVYLELPVEPSSRTQFVLEADFCCGRRTRLRMSSFTNTLMKNYLLGLVRSFSLQLSCALG